jgi:hypothetical protein
VLNPLPYPAPPVFQKRTNREQLDRMKAVYDLIEQEPLKMQHFRGVYENYRD